MQCIMVARSAPSSGRFGRIERFDFHDFETFFRRSSQRQAQRQALDAITFSAFQFDMQDVPISCGFLARRSLWNFGSMAFSFARAWN